LLYEKILVPLDGSKYSIRALQEAIKVGKMTNGSITIIHITPPGSSLAHSSNEQLSKSFTAIGKALLADGKKLAKTEGINVEKMLVEGDATEEIIKAAKNHNFKLIVIGASGLSKLKELVLGSVVHGVIKNAPCPVLVTR